MKRRTCPVGPDICGDIEGWDAFLRHIYEHHTEGSADARQRAVQRILSEGPDVRETFVVPKVSAHPATHALRHVLDGRETDARNLLGGLEPGALEELLRALYALRLLAEETYETKERNQS